MDNRELIKVLDTFGHFSNPAAPLAQSASGNTARLTIKDQATRSAVQSYQLLLKPTLDDLVLKHHNRTESVADGDVGPATRELMTLPRCGFADHGSEHSAHWPHDCRGDLKAGRDFGALPGLNVTETDHVWHAICNNWTAALTDVAITPSDTTDPAKTDFWAVLRRLSGGTLAWHELAVSRCDVTLDGAWDSDRRWSLVFGCTTGTHEFGHGLGMNHNNDGTALMYPIINSGARARRGWPNDTDFAQLARLGYTVTSGAEQPKGDDLFRPRRTNGPPGDPADPTDTVRVIFPKAVKVTLDGVAIEDYFLVPRRSLGL